MHDDASTELDNVKYVFTALDPSSLDLPLIACEYTTS